MRRKDEKMNKAIIMGRLTRDVEVRWSTGENSMAIGRYTVAVNRVARKGAEREADFFNCVAFASQAEFAEKYFRKGMQVLVCGRMQTGSYTNRDGIKIPTFEIMVESQEFAESKKEEGGSQTGTGSLMEGFMNIPDGIEGAFPFN